MGVAIGRSHLEALLIKGMLTSSSLQSSIYQTPIAAGHFFNMACFKHIMLCAIMLLKLHQSDAQECNYVALADAVIKNQTNLYELSRAFFPPAANSPEFVAVSYILNGIENQTWYWSTFTSSFIHPPEVIQFMSLFFAKPHTYYKGKVRISIPKEVAGCVNDLQKMQLLTQRVS